MNSRCLYYVGNTQIIQLAFSFFKKEYYFVTTPVMVPHTDFLFVPDQRFPKTESNSLSYWLSNEHCFLITEQVEMAVLFEDTKALGKQLFKSRVWKYFEPLIT